MNQKSLLTSRILEHMPMFRGAVRIAAEFYLQNDPTEMCRLSIRQAAMRSGVSESSITRFTRQMGFSGYREFRQKLAQDDSALAEHFPVYEGIAPGDGTKHICDAVCSQTIVGIEDTYTLFSPETLEKIAEKILEAQNIYVIAGGRSELAAESLRFRLSRLGLHLQLITQRGEKHWCANYAQKGDLLILFSVWGRDKSDLQLFLSLRAKGVAIALFTAMDNSELARLAHYVVRLAPEEKILDGHTFSTVVQIALVDCIYMLVGQRLGTSVDSVIQKTARSLDLARLDYFAALPQAFDRTNGTLDIDALFEGIE